LKKRKLLILLSSIILAGMILNDFSLHLVELLHVEKLHPFYGFFWLTLSNRYTYTIFWAVYWGIAFILICLQGILLNKKLRK